MSIGEYVTDRINQLLSTRQISKYELAKRSGISLSTLTNLINRKSDPSITTLKKICDGFEITLSQFFGIDEYTDLSKEQRAVLNEWENLTEEQRKMIKTIVYGFKN